MQWIKRTPARLVTFVACAGALTTEVLIELSDVCADRRLRWSVLTGEVEAATSFGAAKALLLQTSAPYPSRLIDAITPSVDVAGRLSRFGSAIVGDVLSADSGVLTLYGYGQGSHVPLLRYVVCSFCDVPGVAVVACAHETGCKHIVLAARNTVLATELRAQIVCLPTCLGLHVSNQRYPDGLSLALALIDGYPAAVLGFLEQGWVYASQVRLLHAALATGARVADASGLFNEIRSFQHLGNAMGVIGDVQSSLSGMRRSMPVHMLEVGNTVVPVPDTINVIRLPTVGRDAFLDLEADGSTVEGYVAGVNYGALVGPTDTTEATLRSYREYWHWLRALANNLVSAKAIAVRLQEAMTYGDLPGERSTPHMDLLPIRSATAAAELILHRALREMSSASLVGAGAANAARREPELRSAINEYSLCFENLVTLHIDFFSRALFWLPN